MNYHAIEFETSFGLLSQLPPSQLTEIAFSGRSNVGKSTLINKIFNRKTLAKVSSVPGKTKTINFFKSEKLRFVDLPGYGFAKVSKAEKRRWADLMEGYFQPERDIALVFQLVDMRHPPTSDDVMMINFLIDSGLPFVIILTKADKLNKTQREARWASLQQEIPYADQVTMIPFSAVNGDGVEEIKAIIDEIEAEIPEEE